MITRVLIISPCNRKTEVLVHFNKIHVKKERLLATEGYKGQDIDYEITTQWNWKAVRMTALVLTEDIKDKLQCLQWVPGLSPWRPFRFCVFCIVFMFNNNFGHNHEKTQLDTTRALPDPYSNPNLIHWWR